MLSINPPLYHYCIVRRDITVGEQAAQLVHAAGESSRLAPDLPKDTNAVAITAPDEATLQALEQKLIAAQIQFRAIRETEGSHAGQLMAIGCAPQPRPGVRRFLSSFPLLR